jgi:methionyl-tRNA formyltransferase
VKSSEVEMRIALIGQAAFGEAVLEALLKEGEQVVVAYAPPDAPGGKVDPLKTAADKHGIPVRQPARMRSPEVVEEFKSFDPELTVMAFVTAFVPMEMLEYPKHGAIQYHPSLLPKHRGGSAINWAIIKGDTKTGLSIFWPDDGWDTGPILLQKEVEIDPDDTVGSLYFNKLFPLGVEAMVESVRLVKEGKAPKIPQDLSQGEHEDLCKKMDIDWSQPIDQVYNVIRGCNPAPGASTTFKGQQVKIFDAEKRMGDMQAEPGTITEIGDGGFLVAGSGGSILVKRLQPKGSPKVKAPEFVESAGVQVGDKLG